MFFFVYLGTSQLNIKSAAISSLSSKAPFFYCGRTFFLLNTCKRQHCYKKKLTKYSRIQKQKLVDKMMKLGFYMDVDCIQKFCI